MARYYFHIRDGWNLIPDDEGMELPSWDAARSEAYASATDLARTGSSRVRAVDVADEAGTLLGSFKVPRAA